MERAILVANDDLFFGGRILSVLEKNGYRALSASTAEDAVKQAESTELALAIVNLNSKRLGGIDLIRRLRTSHRSLRILAFLSHMLIPPVREEVMAAGAHKLTTNGAVSTNLPLIVESMLKGDFASVQDECD